jgi:hypothetical protein
MISTATVVFAAGVQVEGNFVHFLNGFVLLLDLLLEALYLAAEYGLVHLFKFIFPDVLFELVRLYGLLLSELFYFGLC